MVDQLLNEVYEYYLNSNGVSIDTRTVEEGEIFFAIEGDNFDGNEYAMLALEKGAAKVVVSSSSIDHFNAIKVDDTLVFLQKLAKHHRNESKMTLLALTGSNGKTTTKELIAQVLKKQYRIDFTKGNLNNHLGVPLTLLNFRKDLDIGIVEMGSNHVGEIEDLSRIASPNYGLITNIGKAHIGEFGGQENILIAKTELYRNIISNSGVIFCNRKDPVLPRQLEGYENTVFFDSRFQGGVKSVVDEYEPQIVLTVDSEGREYSATLNIGGRHNFMNVQSAIAIGLYFGITPKEIVDQLQTFQAPDNRSQWIKTERNKVFLDAYNANPDSVSAAIEYFIELDIPRKLIIVGDMRELGEYSLIEHQNIFDRLKKSNIPFYLVGEEFSSAVNDDRVFLSKEDLLEHVNLGDVKDTSVLVKASRGIKLESLLSDF